MTPRLLCSLSLCLGLAACGDSDGDPTDPGDTDSTITDATATDASITDATTAPTSDGDVGPWVVIGTGDRRFEAITPGQVVPIIQGIQGGYHVWGAFRGGGFDSTDLRIDFELRQGDTVVANARYTEPELDGDAEGVFDYATVAVIFIDNAEVGPSSGETLTLALELTTQGGVTLTDQTTVVPDCCLLPTGERTEAP